MYRIEQDLVGETKIEKEALYGIHSIRAKNNFPDNTKFHIEWYKALGTVKKACYETYKNFKAAVQKKYSEKDVPLDLISDEIITALISSSTEMEGGGF